MIQEQVRNQPPKDGVYTPLRGRKSLIFSDSRSLSERMAAKMEARSLRESIRPLLLDGYLALQEKGIELSLERVYLAVLIGAVRRKVNLSLGSDELLAKNMEQVRNNLFDHNNYLTDEYLDKKLDRVWNDLRDGLHEAIMFEVISILHHRHTGLPHLGMADVKPLYLDEGLKEEFERLPLPEGISEDGSVNWNELEDAFQRKQAVIQIWLRLLFIQHALITKNCDFQWVGSNIGPSIEEEHFLEKVIFLMLGIFFQKDFIKIILQIPVSGFNF